MYFLVYIVTFSAKENISYLPKLVCFCISNILFFQHTNISLSSPFPLFKYYGLKVKYNLNIYMSRFERLLSFILMNLDYNIDSINLIL